MKKILLVVVVLALLIGGVWYLMRTFGPVNSALYLPEDTVAYLTVTDTLRSFQRWEETELAQIAKEPAVHEFLKKPLEKLGKMGKNEAQEILLGLKPLRIFLAVTSISSTNASWVGGFQYHGGSKDLQRALDRLRAQLNAGLASTPAPIVTQYQGVEITQTLHGNLSLFSAAAGRWCVLAGDEKGIHGLIDRIAGRVKTPTLAGNADFLKGIAALPKDPDFIAFIRVQPVLDILQEIGKGLGAPIKAEQWEQARKVKAMSAAFKLDGRLMRDAMFIQTTEPLSLPKLDYKTVHYTSPGTLVYYAGSSQWPSAQDMATVPIPPDILRGLGEVDLQKILSPEFGFMLSWPANAFRPEGLVAVPLLDSEAAKKIVETVSTTMYPQVTMRDESSARFFTYPTQNPLFTPTIAITKDTLLLGIAEMEVHAAVVKPSDSANVTTSANFMPIKNTWQESSLSFGYFDTKSMFERIYATLQPVMALSSSILPGVNDYIEPSRIPEAAAISKHLTPIVYSQRLVSDGMYMESYGPLTFHQIVLVGAGTWAASTWALARTHR